METCLVFSGFSVDGMLTSLVLGATACELRDRGQDFVAQTTCQRLLLRIPLVSLGLHRLCLETRVGVSLPRDFIASLVLEFLEHVFPASLDSFTATLGSLSGFLADTFQDIWIRR